ncbi:BA75_03980T0 [Komagataella pastoris]|uniref:Peroxin-7 n=1 Tax=Komagataella pastoris TaxID=4922 RepID=A0A1B2JGY6_PICPA|nr:BA75_03980T0 [Komagataella pastoris]
MFKFRTNGFSGYAVRYSPFYDNKIAVATSANYGLVGNGRLYVLSIMDDGNIVTDISFDTQDGLFGVAWSETNENHILVSSGDGSVSLFDTTLKDYPVMKFTEHEREVFSVDWSNIDKNLFCTASWDGSVKIWSPGSNRNTSLLTLRSLASREDKTGRIEKPIPIVQPSQVPMSKTRPNMKNDNNDCVYDAKFSFHDPNIIISCNSDSHLQLWDTRLPNPLFMDFVAHNGLEALSCDFNRYRPFVVASAGVDKLAKVWDTRMIQRSVHSRPPRPLNKFMGHEFAIRKLAWSPHSPTQLLTCSYDMTVRVWNDNPSPTSRVGLLDGASQPHAPPCSKIFSAHTEFVMGCDWSLWGEPGWVVTTGWDEMVYVWNTQRLH